MSVITAVKYDVLEHILKKWLEENFGDQAAYEPASNETSGAGYWKVTAPREITQPEQRALKKQGTPKKRKTLEH